MEWGYFNKTVSDVLQLYNENKLIIRPVFQRNVVWTESSMAQFIESILLGMPIPPIYYHEKMVDNKHILFVIDGQQRLNSIINFYENNLTLKNISSPDLNDLTFSSLNDDQPLYTQFMNYELPGIKLYNSSEDEIREFYARINKNTVNLNDQEIRRAMYPGDYLDMSEILSQMTFWKRTSFFTKAKINRLGNVEYISELLAILFEGIQDKKNTLNNFYEIYKDIGKTERKRYLIKFVQTIKKIYKLFDGYENIRLSRFKKQSDFYSLFSLISELDNNTYNNLLDKNEEFLEFIELFNYAIAPESEIEILSTYAIKCVSQANSRSSREWRKLFLRDIALYITTEQINETVSKLIHDINTAYELDIQEGDLNISLILEEIVEIDSYAD